MFNRILDVFLDALKDSLLALPILFICYLLIELLEERLLHKYKSKALKSKWAPVFGASIGLIPQCGFSVVASDLYSKRIITIGSLFAIFIATSDEALPLMLSTPNFYGSLAIILLVKFVYAVVVGLSIDFIFSIKNKKNFSKTNGKNLDIIKENTIKIPVEIIEKNAKEIQNESPNNENKNLEESQKSSEDFVVLDNEKIKGCCNHKLESVHEKTKEIIIHPLKHSLIIFAYILLINILFGLLVEFVGEDAIATFISRTTYFEPFLASLVGLIPNCASSVVLTKVFIAGDISIGSCIAGLCVNSGLALVTLFKINKNIKENLAILFTLFMLGSVLGLIINLF